MSGWRSGFAQNTFSLIFKNNYIIDDKQQFTERLLNSQTKLTFKRIIDIFILVKIY